MSCQHRKKPAIRSVITTMPYMPATKSWK